MPFQRRDLPFLQGDNTMNMLAEQDQARLEAGLQEKAAQAQNMRAQQQEKARVEQLKKWLGVGQMLPAEKNEQGAVISPERERTMQDALKDRSFGVNKSGIQVGPPGGGMGGLQKFLLGENRRGRNQVSAEAARVAGQYHKSAKDLRTSVRDMQLMQNMLNNLSTYSLGRFRTGLAKMSGENRPTDEDVERMAQTEWGESLARGWNTGPATLPLVGEYLPKFSEETLNKPLSDAQMKTIRRDLEARINSIKEQLSAEQQEINQVAPYLAPTMSEQGTLPNLMHGIGLAPRTGAQGLVEHPGAPAPNRQMAPQTPVGNGGGMAPEETPRQKLLRLRQKYKGQ